MPERPPTTLEEARAWLECTCTTLGVCERCQPDREREIARHGVTRRERKKHEKRAAE